MTKKKIPFLVFLGGVIGLPAFVLFAQEVGERVIKQGRITDDIYIAGGDVQILGEVDGDVTAAGGTIKIGEIVKGDVIAAGGTVAITANVGDDIRAAGGDVTLTGNVGDDAILAGGSVKLQPEVHVGGRAWIAGGELSIAGRITDELRAGGGSIVLSADVDGDVHLAAESISIQPPAVIRGNLSYRSPREADIDSGAKILGEITRHPYETEGLTPMSRTAFYAVFLISLAIAALVLFFLFPRFSIAAAKVIESRPLWALGIGLAILVTVPFAATLLLISIIGLPLAFAALALYAVALLAGFLTAVIYVGDAGFRLLKKDTEISTGARVLSIIGALVLIMLLRLVPVLGGLVTFALLIFGTGALALRTYRTYTTA